MLQGSRRQTPLQYPARLANLGIVDFFNLGCGWLSRFSNHEELVVGYILAKDKATVAELPILQTIGGHTYENRTEDSNGLRQRAHGSLSRARLRS